MLELDKATKKLPTWIGLSITTDTKNTTHFRGTRNAVVSVINTNAKAREVVDASRQDEYSGCRLTRSGGFGGV